MPFWSQVWHFGLTYTSKYRALNSPDRRTHPQYSEINREAARRRQRDRRRRAASRDSPRFAKMDASMADSPVPSGTYRLVPAAAGEFAKMDAWMVEITLVSKAYGQAEEVCKERT